VPVGRLIQEIEKITHETSLKHIRVRTDLPPDLWTVSGDPTQIHQVLLNFCVNARDAMPTTGTLTLSARNVLLDEQYATSNPEAKPGPSVVITIEDNGTGMAPEVLEKNFGFLRVYRLFTMATVVEKPPWPTSS
jgi:signal transduction histidine kinase